MSSPTLYSPMYQCCYCCVFLHALWSIHFYWAHNHPRFPPLLFILHLFKLCEEPLVKIPSSIALNYVAIASNITMQRILPHSHFVVVKSNSPIVCSHNVVVASVAAFILLHSHFLPLSQLWIVLCCQLSLICNVKQSHYEFPIQNEDGKTSEPHNKCSLRVISL